MNIKIILPIVWIYFVSQITIYAQSSADNKFYKIAVSGDEIAVKKALLEINEEAKKSPISYVNDMEALLRGLSIASKKNENLCPLGLEVASSMFERAFDNSTVDSTTLSALLLYKNPLFISSSILGSTKLVDWNNPNYEKALTIESKFLLNVQRKFNPCFQPDKEIFILRNEMVLDSNGKNGPSTIKSRSEEELALRMKHIEEYEIQQSCKRILDMCMPAFIAKVNGAIESNPKEIKNYRKLFKKVGYLESETEKISLLLK